MDCQRCGNPATVHVVQTVGPKKREVRLCDGCAKAADLLPAGGTDGLNLPALVGLLMGLPAAGGLECPGCGQTFAGFRADGRLGCPAEYDAFRPALEPLLERIHRKTAHAGKRPRAAGRRAHLAGLRADLARAVAGERYEDAAGIRDQLRAAEGGGADEPG